CWDELHAARPGVNVIAASAPRGNDSQRSRAPSISPAAWYRAIGVAYRGSGRKRPILDTVGHNAYPDTSAERPWAPHMSGPTRAGDYGKLMSVLSAAFAGTAQPLPGQSGVSIWYMEQGFQSAVPAAELPSYRGRETDRFALPAAPGGAGPDQATQIEDAV